MHPLFLLSLLLLSTQTLSDQGERSALLDFKNSTRSDPLGLLSRWSGADHCSWPGVACDASLRVVALNLSGSSLWDPTRKLSVRLTPSLGRLTALTTLSLPFQNLDGEIPDELWRLTKLEVVDLEGNSISGTLASASVFPSSLRVLNLASNSITGEIPPSLASCLYLETLDLSGNKLNGSIPNFLGSFSKLRVLRLSYNRLGGRIPVEIGGCESLEHLELSGNLLIRGIPPSLGNCSDMKYLILSSNLLEGSVPPELGKLKKLRVLDVSRNCFSGVVPVGLGDCVELEVLVLSSQYEPMLSMSSSNWAKNDDFNYFQGGISEKITSLSQLRVLWAPRTMLEGVFPKNWGECKSLEVVNLGGNFFTGEIPSSFGACENLKLLNLSSNILTGWLTDELPMSCLSVFDVSGNKFSGTVPKFIYRKCPSSSFMPYDIPAIYSSFFLDKARQELALPSFESPGDSVVYHNYGRNYFSGSLPSFPTDNSGKQTVYALFADENSLVGSLNDTLYGMCNYFHGLILNLRSNLISGGVPVYIGTTCRALIVLDVAGNEITGMIPRSLGLLGILVGLDLSMNQLQGKIPTDLGKLSSLKYLSLAGNNLSGHIPAEFEQLHSLQSLDLSSNSLAGEIPSSLTRLTNLTVVLLNNNKLYGDIPSGFANLRLTMFNASYNNLSGPLPSNASSLRCESLISNPLLQPCNMSSLSVPPSYVQGRSSNSQSYAEPPESSPRKTSGFNSIEIASVTSAVVIVVVLLLLILLYIYTRKCAPGSSANSLGRREVAIFVDIGVPLTYEGVVRATGNFNASNCIGSGGFGATYKAEISPGVLVAIKRLSVGRIQGVQQFHAEIKTLGRWRHPNLVTLIGYHIGDAEMFLIYNYLPGGNLERFIQERSKRATDWRMLHKIAFDVAKALAYLHDQCVPRILHRDVKPSNILLDNDFTACLSDFGLARLLGNSETHATTGVAGTFGYVAPEYAMTCRVSDKADVYSYGVVLLELLSDKKALDPSFSPYGNGFNIVTWAGLLLEEGRAHEFFTEGLWDVAPHDDLAETLHLAIRCTGDSLPVRPTMNQVVRRLKELEPPCQQSLSCIRYNSEI